MNQNYGMQPAQPQYNQNFGMQPAQPQQYNQNPYGAPAANYGAPQQNQYNTAPPPQQNQYNTAPPPQQNQYNASPNPYANNQTQQPNPTTANPYANNEPTQQKEESEDSFAEKKDKDIYAGNTWVFTPEWDEAQELKAKTACCCCNCAFDDCNDWAQIQCEAVCLCITGAVVWQVCQCQDKSQRACCLNTSKVSCLDFTSEDEDVFCRLYNCGINGIFCLCCSGKAYESVCDPCQMPDTFCKQLCQVFCIHLRVALPCDEEQVPFEIGCCGVMCKEQEQEES